MKIVAVMGTYRKNGAGAAYIKKIEKTATTRPEVTFEYLWLGDADMKLCRGCMVCYDRGEAACPLADGYLDMMQKLNDADAAIFYSPTYTLSISGLMKTFFDRSSYVLHRPYFKGRHAVVLTAVESYGERTALKTLKTIVSMMGFAVDGAIPVVNARYQSNAQYRARIDSIIERQALQLQESAASGKIPRPSLFELVTFYFQKASFGADTEGCRNDKQYWRNAGWASPQADFYCKAAISPVKKRMAKWIVAGLKKSRLLG